MRGDYTYIGGYYNNLQETGIEAGDFGQLNLSAGIQFNVVSLQLFARNLTNENAYTWAESLIPDGRAYQLRPRTVGVTVGYRF